jgi:uncharacterized protein YdhG (YjbR/CyaY superfamily)
MAKTDFKSVDEYIASQPEAAQSVLKRVRSTIRKAVPGADEEVPVKLIEGIAKLRAKEVAAREKAKSAPPKRR